MIVLLEFDIDSAEDADELDPGRQLMEVEGADRKIEAALEALLGDGHAATLTDVREDF